MMISASSFASRDHAGDALDVGGAARRALLQNFGLDLRLDRGIGLRQQVAVGARPAGLVDQLAALGVDLGVLGIVLGRTVEQRAVRGADPEDDSAMP